VRSDAEHGRIALFGLGGVGRAFLELLAERPRGLRLVAAADSGGALTGELSPSAVLERKAAGALPPGPDTSALIRETAPGVIVDLSSCDFHTAEPALTIISAGLASGAAVVTANKAPLARAWDRLGERANGSGRIGYTAAAGAALPAVAVARALRRSGEVESFDAVLTGTTTFVLDAMSAGASAEDAVRAAQTQGIAEPEPSIDVGGWDTAAKLVILARTLWDCDLGLDQVEVAGIDAADPDDVRRGGVRLVGHARRTGDRVEARVGPLRLGADHPLARLRGSDKGVVFHGPVVGDVLVAGGRSHPRAAAAAALGDVLAFVEEAR
jgi:homoserine dehydrogenase